MNIFFEKLQTPFETLPFEQISIDDYLPAIKKAMNLARERIQRAKNSSDRTFSGFVFDFLESSRELDLIVYSFFNLLSAHTNDKMEKVARELSPMVANFSNDLLLDGELFSCIKKVYENREAQNLTVEEQAILEDQYRCFVRNGAMLGEKDKKKLREVDTHLSQLGVEFGSNVLQAKNQYCLSLEKKDLEGIPKENWEMFENAASERGLSGYAITFDFPVYSAFMKDAEKRSLRESIYRDFVKTATSGEFDNRGICLEIVRLRKRRAHLLGYENHAAFVMERRMAQTPQRVLEFLDNLKESSLSKAKQEVKELLLFAKQRDGLDKLMPWDFSFYGEKYKKHLFDFDDSLLRPYFQLEKVIDGVFEVAFRLYGLRFKENSKISKYHEDVKAFEVSFEGSDKVSGILYGDFFPRLSKRQGAWMCSYREQCRDAIPHVGIVCNFTKSTSTKPSLLTHNEVLTLFHEFGHALHALLSECQYRALSGTQVYWDFVELPSQIMENWVFEKECLDIFARHYKTGEPIDKSLVNKIKKSRTFLEGYATIRQLSLATLDMTLHTKNIDGLGEDKNSLLSLEKEIMGEFNLFDYWEEGASVCASFGHIFNGGYSAGYYSYKWAEVLDAHAFEVFQEKGIFDREAAESFQNNILSKGGTEHPMTLYQRFRKEKPDISSLLRRCDLL